MTETVTMKSETEKKYRIAVIIINYRTPLFVQDCLESICEQLSLQKDCIIIVDNNSGDGSDDVIQNFILVKKWNELIKIVRSKINGGFSAGNNIGINQVEAEYYLLLNSDTIVLPGAIDALMDASVCRKDAGLISPRLEWPNSVPQESCFRHRGPTHEFFSAASTSIIERLFGYKGSAYPISEDPMYTDWTSFACVMIRCEVFERIGLLDEGYFMYFDDTDFCMRSWDAGFAVLHWPKARVVHLRGGSGPLKKLKSERKRPPRYWYASRNRYYKKFFGQFGLIQANFYWCLGRLISLFREIIMNKEPHTSRSQWFDIWTNVLQPLRRKNPPI